MGQRHECGAMGGQRTSQLADLSSHRDEHVDVFRGAVAAHGLNVKLLEPLL